MSQKEGDNVNINFHPQNKSTIILKSISLTKCINKQMKMKSVHAPAQPFWVAVVWHTTFQKLSLGCPPDSKPKGLPTLFPNFVWSHWRGRPSDGTFCHSYCPNGHLVSCFFLTWLQQILSLLAKSSTIILDVLMAWPLQFFWVFGLIPGLELGKFCLMPFFCSFFWAFSFLMACEPATWHCSVSLSHCPHLVIDDILVSLMVWTFVTDWLAKDVFYHQWTQSTALWLPIHSGPPPLWLLNTLAMASHYQVHGLIHTCTELVLLVGTVRCICPPKVLMHYSCWCHHCMMAQLPLLALVATCTHSWTHYTHMA